MLEFLFEAFGEILIESLARLAGHCVQQLVQWARNVL
jgi:hypothetical protein